MKCHLSFQIKCLFLRKVSVHSHYEPTGDVIQKGDCNDWNIVKTTDYRIVGIRESFSNNYCTRTQILR